MNTSLLQQLLLRTFLGIFFYLSLAHAAAGEEFPAAHILMPAYNTQEYTEQSIASVMNQSHPGVKLLVLNDGSSDGTGALIERLRAKYPNKIHVKSHPKNLGVAATRKELIAWSKLLDPNAYIFWLDSDDQYTDPHLVQDVVKQMQRTKADICLFNFSIAYEDENQKGNAAELIKRKGILEQHLDIICSSPSQTCKPLDLADLLEITALG